MAGALARRFGYADGGDVDEEYPQAYVEPDPIEEGPNPPGPLSQAQQGGDDADDRLAALGSIIGSPKEVTGALSAAKNSAADATKRQIALIRDAMDRIPNPNSNGANLPLMAFAAGLGSSGGPGGGFGRGLANMYEAYRTTQADDLKRAELRNQLGLAEGQAGVKGAGDQFDILKERLGIGERAAQASETIKQRREQAAAREAAARESATERAAVQREAIAQREAAAEAAAADRKARTDESAQYHRDLISDREQARRDTEQFSSYVGTDKDTGFPIFANRLGQTKLGDRVIAAKPSTAGSAETALQKNMRELIKSGVAKDETAAFNLLKASGNSSTSYASLVERIKERLTRTGKVDPEDPDTFHQYTTQELDQAARKEARDVTEEAKKASTPQPRFTAPFAGADTQGIAKDTKAAPAAPPAAPVNNKPPAGKNPNQLRDEAKAAISRGAPRDAVLKRLRDWGIDTSGL